MSCFVPFLQKDLFPFSSDSISKFKSKSLFSVFLCCFISFQSLIKDPKLSSIVLNPHVKRSIKQKTFNDALNKAKLSPITINLISEY